MTLSYHPYGKPYFHIPTGKVIYLDAQYLDGSFSAHYRYREHFEGIMPEDLRTPMDDEIEKDYPIRL